MLCSLNLRSCGHGSSSSHSDVILISRSLRLQYNRDSLELLLSAIDCLPLDIYAGNGPTQGSVDRHQNLILFFNKLSDHTSSIARSDLFHLALHRSLTSLKLLDVILKIMGVYVLLLSFNIFPAFITSLFLKGKKSELRVVIGECALCDVLAL